MIDLLYSLRWNFGYVSFSQGFGDFLRAKILIYHKVFSMSNGHAFLEDVFIIL